MSKHISERLIALKKLKAEIEKHLPKAVDYLIEEIEKEELVILKRNAIRARKKAIGK